MPFTLTESAAALRSGELLLRGYLEALCDRIDATEPQVHALLAKPDRRARLIREATKLKTRYPGAEASRPSLFGVPVGVKDIFRVNGFPTRCGSALPEELFAGLEASCVAALRRAGALILGKTVTTEFAYFEPGPTRNPRNPAHTPGGSSSGSAAAVAAGYCPLALGSQTVGSVIRPAAFCGVVGFKPSYCRIPLDGVIPYAPSLDHVGFFVPAAHDLPLAASVLMPDYAEEQEAGQSALGVPDGPYLETASPEALAAFEAQVAQLRAAGRRIERVPALEDMTELARLHNLLSAYELAQTHTEWFARYEHLYRPRTAAWIREGQQVPPEAAEAARSARLEVRNRLETLMEKHGIDAWICPAATGPAPEGLESTGNPWMNGPWTFAGMPAVTIPAGSAANGLPLGLQCVGRFNEDARLISLAINLAPELDTARYPWH